METVIDDEGERLKPYLCTAKKLTIGYGRNLSDNGITKAEAMMMLQHDLGNAKVAAARCVSNFAHLTDARQEVVVQMIYQLGEPGFKKFRKTIAYIESCQWHKGAEEMLDSLWAKQTPNRARRTSQKFLRG